MGEGVLQIFKISYFFEILPVIASKVNVTFELTIISTIFALLIEVIVAIIGYYKIASQRNGCTLI